MIPLSPATRVLVVTGTGTTDMRKSFDGLHRIVAMEPRDPDEWEILRHPVGE